MEEKSNKLLDMMKKIDDQKPANWGLKKAVGGDTTGGDDIDMLNKYGHNMDKALKKLELQEKLDKLHAAKNISDEEKKKLAIEAHREKLLDARNVQRQNDLMRTTFLNMNEEE